jgi:hypothetical protein
LGFSTTAAALWLAVFAWARMPSFAPLEPATRTALLAQLRAAWDGRPPPPDALGDRALHGPLVVVAWDRGAPIARVIVRAPTLRVAAVEAARQLGAAALPADIRARARLKVDLVLARAPLFTRIQPLYALSLVPGLDGIGVAVDGREAVLLPDDLMRAEVFSHTQPTQAMEFEIGADTEAIEWQLRRELALDDAAWSRARRHLYRLRTDAFIEPARAPASDSGAALPVVRGLVPGPPLSRENLRAAAIAGGKYLLRHLYEDGHFGYEYLPALDQDAPFGLDYSLPRHAGAVYYLAQIYGATRDPAFKEGAVRAMRFLQARAAGACGRADRACIAGPDMRTTDIGSAAMTLVAIAEYAGNTGDVSVLAWGRRLAAFLLYMQKPDGDFCHLYDPVADARDEKAKLLYYSGEAVFALAKLVNLVGPRDPDYARYVAAFDRGLDYLTGKGYDFLAGQFFFGEDHWTCLAVDAGYDALPPAARERYARFCDQFVAFLRRTQFTERDSVTQGQPDFVGAYGFSPFLPPHPTPVGSRSETTLSTYLLQRRRGRGDSRDGQATREQILYGLRFLLAHQISDDNAYMMQDPEAARGGFLMSDVKRFVRIDFIQHACSAMLRAIDIL